MRKPSLTVDVASPVDNPPVFASDDIYGSRAHTTTLTTLSSTLKTNRNPFPTSDEKFDVPEPPNQPNQPAPPTEPYVPPQPSFRLLFSLIVRGDAIILAPAILAAVCAAAMPPLMTVVIGQAFDTFARFPLTSNPSQEARADLLHSIGLVAIYLTAIAAGTFFLSGALSALWIWYGERTVMRLRRLVYGAVASREMEWFDLGAGAESGEGQESVGAGGLMAKFAR
jgi:ATP-binding cassette, subfamily B (MDR/TAP), member 1